MNETDREQRDRILKMLSDGTLKPDEAAKLLAALSPSTEATPGKQDAAKKPAGRDEGKEKPKEKPKPQTMEVQMQRADGSSYTVELPASVVPMVMKMAGVALRESARTASKEAWDGFKTMVRNKTDEVKTTVKDRVARPSGKAPAAATAPAPEEDPHFEARRRILQMVQNGRISAGDASRLIQELDALREYQKGSSPDSKS